jgi:hypothetical protein
LPPALGTFIAKKEKSLEFSVPRAAAAEAAALLLKHLPVDDLTISEPDISVVIESLIKGERQVQ